MATATAEKQAKPRNRTAVTYVVQRQHDDADLWLDQAIAADTAAAMRWIKELGAAGTTYRVARVGPSVTVTVTTIEKRALA